MTDDTIDSRIGKHFPVPDVSGIKPNYYDHEPIGYIHTKPRFVRTKVIITKEVFEGLIGGPARLIRSAK